MITRQDVSAKALENTMIPISSKSMGGGTLTAVIGYLSSSGAAVLIGIIVTVLGFAFNLYFQRKRHHRELEEWRTKKKYLQEEDRRKEELHQATLARISGDMCEKQQQ